MIGQRARPLAGRGSKSTRPAAPLPAKSHLNSSAGTTGFPDRGSLDETNCQNCALRRRARGQRCVAFRSCLRSTGWRTSVGVGGFGEATTIFYGGEPGVSVVRSMMPRASVAIYVRR